MRPKLAVRDPATNLPAELSSDVVRVGACPPGAETIPLDGSTWGSILVNIRNRDYLDEHAFCLTLDPDE